MIKKRFIQLALENIYINPLEQCNLNCKLCYTKKTNFVLSNEKILDFVNRYREKINLKSIVFCGGEVFILPDFPALINKLLKKNIFITIITNGTIDRLVEIKEPNNCQILVSLDGPQKIHDRNRGEGNYQKSLNFIQKALDLGFPTEVMYLVTPKSYKHTRCFTLPVKINYITQKAGFFSKNCRQKGLSPKQIVDIKKNYPSVPPKDFGCFQLSLQSNGLIYECCESPTPLAKMTDKIEIIVDRFKKSLITCQKCGQCQGCCQPNFLCGYVKELGQKNCSEMVKLLQNA